jgi:ribosomal protein L40E
MSSATSIKRASDAPVAVAEPSRTAEDPGFRPWHFFVLASLIAATVAVVLSRGATPEHLILISLAIGAAGAAAAALYRTIAPLTTSDPTAFSEPLSVRSRAAIEREKTLTLRALKDLEFDKAMGKLSPRDYDEMAGRLRTRAVSLMKELDEDRGGYAAVIERELQSRMAAPRTESARPSAPAAVAEPTSEETNAEVGSCAVCRTVNDPDATFCKRCGTRLVPGDAE